MTPEQAGDFAELFAAYGGRLFGVREAAELGVSPLTLAVLAEAHWIEREPGFRVRNPEAYPQPKGNPPRLRHEWAG